MLESAFQAQVIRELRRRLDGCVILKNDTDYLQGIPDLLVLWRDRWAMLECKASEDSPYQPNQEYYLELLNEMSFAATIYPENMDEVLDAIQHAFQARRRARVSVR